MPRLTLVSFAASPILAFLACPPPATAAGTIDLAFQDATAEETLTALAHLSGQLFVLKSVPDQPLPAQGRLESTDARGAWAAVREKYGLECKTVEELFVCRKLREGEALRSPAPVAVGNKKKKKKRIAVALTSADWVSLVRLISEVARQPITLLGSFDGLRVTAVARNTPLGVLLAALAAIADADVTMKDDVIHVVQRNNAGQKQRRVIRPGSTTDESAPPASWREPPGCEPLSGVSIPVLGRVRAKDSRDRWQATVRCGDGRTIETRLGGRVGELRVIRIDDTGVVLQKDDRNWRTGEHIFTEYFIPGPFHPDRNRAVQVVRPPDQPDDGLVVSFERIREVAKTIPNTRVTRPTPGLSDHVLVNIFGEGAPEEPVRLVAELEKHGWFKIRRMIKGRAEQLPTGSLSAQTLSSETGWQLSLVVSLRWDERAAAAERVYRDLMRTEANANRARMVKAFRLAFLGAAPPLARGTIADMFVRKDVVGWPSPGIAPNAVRSAFETAFAVDDFETEADEVSFDLKDKE